MSDHAGFVAAAYAVTALVLGATILAILLDHRAQRRAIERLTRRAGSASEDIA